MCVYVCLCVVKIKRKSLVIMAIVPQNPSGYFLYHQVWRSKLLPSVHTVYLCVSCGSQNKRRLFSYIEMTDSFYNRDGECLLRGTTSICNYDWN